MLPIPVNTGETVRIILLTIPVIALKVSNGIILAYKVTDVDTGVYSGRNQGPEGYKGCYQAQALLNHIMPREPTGGVS